MPIAPISQPSVEIRLKDDIRLPKFARYVKKKEFLSKEDREIEVYIGDEKILSTNVPISVFNPYLPRKNKDSCSDAEFFTGLVLNGEIDVKGKKVVDLGCGSGIIGLASILRGASGVLFTDLNPNIISLKQHKLIRKSDVVKVQDLLSDEPHETYDVIIFSLPALFTARNDIEIDHDDFMTGVASKTDLGLKCVTQASAALKPGGTLFMSTSISLESPLASQEFMMSLYEAFDLSSMRMLSVSEFGSPLKEFLRWVYQKYISRAPVSTERRGRFCFSIEKN